MNKNYAAEKIDQNDLEKGKKNQHSHKKISLNYTAIPFKLVQKATRKTKKLRTLFGLECIQNKNFNQ